MKQNRDLTDRNWILRHCGLDERAWSCEVHIHQEAVAVNPAGVRGRLLGLPREVCAVSGRERNHSGREYRVTGRGDECGSPIRRRTKGVVRQPDRGAEVSRGHSRC